MEITRMGRRFSVVQLSAMVLLGLAVMPDTAAGQSSVYHLHAESLQTGINRLLIAGPDAASSPIQSPDLNGVPVSGEYIFAQFGTMAGAPGFTGTLASGWSLPENAALRENRHEHDEHDLDQIRVQLHDGERDRIFCCGSIVPGCGRRLLDLAGPAQPNASAVPGRDPERQLRLTGYGALSGAASRADNDLPDPDGWWHWRRRDDRRDQFRLDARHEHGDLQRDVDDAQRMGR